MPAAATLMTSAPGISLPTGQTQTPISVLPAPAILARRPTPQRATPETTDSRATRLEPMEILTHLNLRRVRELGRAQTGAVSAQTTMALQERDPTTQVRPRPAQQTARLQATLEVLLRKRPTKILPPAPRIHRISMTRY